MSYRLVLAHSDQHALAAELRDAVMNSLEGTPNVANLLEILEELSEEPMPQVVAYLASEAGSKDHTVNEMIKTALANDLAVVPVVKVTEADKFAEIVPESLKRVNAVFWQDGGVLAVSSLLQILGLVEKARKIFISYRQSETRELAAQLHTALIRQRFDVFLDRFSVDPGVDFQHRLEEELGDKAFVLLLESDGLQESKWVRHEIAYAHAHGIELLALTLPDCTNKVVSIADSFRHNLATNDVTSDGKLTANALASTLDAIELAHAQALRRRREQTLGSVKQQLQMIGCVCRPVADWCVLATRQEPKRRGLFWVTPRQPTTVDFYDLTKQKARVEATDISVETGMVVHNAGRLAVDYQALMDWLAEVSNNNLATINTCAL